MVLIGRRRGLTRRFEGLVEMFGMSAYLSMETDKQETVLPTRYA
jgi:hypothetical protein